MADFFVDTRPLFVLGTPRSGTTFLHQVLNQHPGIILTDELRVVSWWVRETNRLRGGHAEHGGHYPFHHGAEFADYLSGNAERLLAPFYSTLAEKAGKQDIVYWGDKYPHYDEVLDLMPHMFPRARYVMIHRDLRDTICSVMSGHDWEADRAAAYISLIYRRYIRKLERLQTDGLIDADTVVHTSFVTLNRQVEAESRRIIEALGLDVDEATLAAMADRAGIQAHSVRYPGDQPTAFDFAQSDQRWRRDLDQTEIEIVNEALDPIRSEIATGEKFSDMAELA
jgi:hypothetical protein